MNGYLRASQLVPGQKVNALHFAHPGNLMVESNEVNTNPRFAGYARVVTFRNAKGQPLHWYYTPAVADDDSPEWQLVQQPEATE